MGLKATGADDAGTNSQIDNQIEQFQAQMIRELIRSREWTYKVDSTRTAICT